MSKAVRNAATRSLVSGLRSSVRAMRAVALLLAVVVTGLSAADGPTLIDAVKRGDRPAVRALLKNRAAVNVAEPDGMTALHWAVRGDDLELVTQLLRAGANVKAANRYGLQPITLAATNGNAPIMTALLDAGADPNATTDAGEPVVMTAARTGKVDPLKLLLQRGARAGATERWFGESAIMWAAAENHAAAVRLLAEAGADVNLRSTLMEAPVLEFPRSGGPNSPFPRGGWTALMYAARSGAVDAARALADLGADLDAIALPQTDVPMKPAEIAAALSGRVGTTALVFAIINSHYDLAAALLEKGANPNVADMTGMAALYAAVDMSSLQWVQGRPAPILTDQRDAADLVKLLLEKGADPNARLSRAPLKRHHDAGTTLNFGSGATALMRAARTNDVAVMKLLLDGGADAFLTLPDKTNTLMIAAGQGLGGLRGEGIRIVTPTEQGAVEAVKLLLDHGMDPDAFNTTGNTALHAAVTRGDEVVKLLVSRGASMHLKNKANLTPLDLASGAGPAGRGGRGAVVRESTAALLRQLMQDKPASQGAATVR